MGIFDEIQQASVKKEETSETTEKKPIAKIYFYIAKVVILCISAGVFMLGYSLFRETFSLPQISYWNSLGIVLCATILTRGILTNNL